MEDMREVLVNGKRFDSKYQENGAEFLIMSQLLLMGVPTFKMPFNHEGYDLVCVNPVTKRMVTIQVKSKNVTSSSNDFNVKPDKSIDFFVFVKTDYVKKIKDENNWKYYVNTIDSTIGYWILSNNQVKTNMTKKTKSQYINPEKIKSSSRNWKKIIDHLNKPLIQVNRKYRKSGTKKRK